MTVKKALLYLVMGVLVIGLITFLYSRFTSEQISINTNTSDFNQDWKFALDDSQQWDLTTIKDQNWRSVQLPHDWSIEASFDSINGEGATGYLPGGIGWYRKYFDVNNSAQKETFIYFDGVYNNADVWINDHKLGFHPYGYSPFYYNITNHLKPTNNILTVKVDRTRYADSRWYSGSGIYRKVKLVQVNPLHIPIWGTFITTPIINDQKAAVAIEIKINNTKSDNQQFTLKTEIFGPNGKIVADKNEMHEIGGHQTTITQQIDVLTPLLWTIAKPNLYKAVTSIIQNEEVIHRYETPFGIRSVKFDPNTGFFLNGENMKIKGVCLHHDAGLVGAAVPKGVWRRRLLKLKEAGCNAIRISHNPGSEEFLDLCDEMGFLVQNEFFDEWDNPKDKRLNKWETKEDYVTQGYGEYFQEWAERDLKNTMLRDRNHPSIIQWSIGNEIEWTYPRYSSATGYFDMDWRGNYFWELPPHSPDKIKERFEASEEGQYVLAKTAKKLADWTKSMDTTRPVIANCILPSSSHVSGYADAIDIIGYSYRRVLYDYGHENYPNKVIMGTENLGQWHEWKSVEERPHIAGTFLWTGIDYMGESNAQWPKKATASGLLDLAGFEKPSYHMMKSLWKDEPHIHIATQSIDKSINKIDESTGKLVAKDPNAWKHALWTWHNVNDHWNYLPNELISVEVYSNCEEIELFLNDMSIGKRKLEEFEDHIYKWAVPFETGKLVAIGTKAGEKTSATINTSTDASSIRLKADKLSLKANGYDVTHIEVQITDNNGNPVKTDDRVIEFSTKGKGKILGVDTGKPENVQDFQANKILTAYGRCLVIVQSTTESGTFEIMAKSPGLEMNSIKINIK